MNTRFISFIEGNHHFRHCFVLVIIGFLVCSLFVSACGRKEAAQQTNQKNNTNSLLVSIGVLNSVDTNERAAICRLFMTNGVQCGLSGTLMFDLMIKRDDIERAQKIWETNVHPKVDFTTIWDKN
jgi:hypothetical protein